MKNTAEKIVAAFGKPRVLAAALDLDTTTVWRWTKSGKIPHWHKPAILAAASKHGVRVSERMLANA